MKFNLAKGSTSDSISVLCVSLGASVKYLKWLCNAFNLLPTFEPESVVFFDIVQIRRILCVRQSHADFMLVKPSSIQTFFRVFAMEKLFFLFLLLILTFTFFLPSILSSWMPFLAKSFTTF